MLLIVHILVLHVCRVVIMTSSYSYKMQVTTSGHMTSDSLAFVHVLSLISVGLFDSSSLSEYDTMI